MILEQFPKVKLLSASEKLLFVSELWNDLADHPTEIPVSGELIDELDRRIERFESHPNEFTTWESVKSKLLGAGQ